MSVTVIVVLGAPNDDLGSLSWISRDRCREALNQHRLRPGSLLLPVGGFGAQFNRTGRPHWHYVREYLLKQGVADAAVLVGVDSSNTREDALLTQDRLECLGIRHAVVVTSDFHRERAAWHFRRVAGGVSYEFVAARSSRPDEELRRLQEHEFRSMAAKDTLSKDE